MGVSGRARSTTPRLRAVAYAMLGSDAEADDAVQELSLRSAGGARQREIVEAFLAASRDGDIDAVAALLDPDVTLRADDTAVHIGAPSALHGAAAVSTRSLRGARAAHLALVDGAAGLVWAPGGSPWMVFNFTLTNGTVTAIDLLADPERIRQLDIVVLDD
jgi:RNA polymerase sigma-70 factor, ECF subfamily